MPIAFVQEADAASATVTLGTSATAGNTLIVAAACLGPTSATGATGVTLGGSPDNFALITPGPPAQDTTSPGDYISVTVWADANCAGGSTVAVTGTGVLAVWVFEFSGLSGTADLAQVFAVSTYQDSWVTALGQTSLPAEAWFAVTCAANQVGAETLSVNNVTGWTLETAHAGTTGTYDWGAISGYQTLNTAGTPAWSGAFSQASFSVTVLVTLGAGAPPAVVTANAPLVADLAVTGALAVQGGVNVAGAITQAGAPLGLSPVGPVTGNWAAKAGQLVLANYSQGPALPVITLPVAPPNGSPVGVKLVTNPSGLVTVQASGTDVIDAPGTTSVSPTGTGTVFILQYQSATATWYTQSTGGQLPGPPAANATFPADAGFVTWAYDPAVMTGPLAGVALPSGGNVTLVKCPVRATANISTIEYYIASGAPGSGLTSGENFAGVYTSQGALLCATADQTSAWEGVAGVPQAPAFTGGPVAINPPWVWAAFLCNGTTGPSFAATASVSAAWANGHLSSVRGWRFAQLVGSFTSLPSSFALIGGTGGCVAAATQYWVGLY